MKFALRHEARWQVGLPIKDLLHSASSEIRPDPSDM